MSSWRPEGWKVKDPCETCADWEGCNALTCYDDGYEAGADAMLEALKQHYTFAHIYDKEWYVNREGGAWVFIPEEQP